MVPPVETGTRMKTFAYALLLPWMLLSPSLSSSGPGDHLDHLLSLSIEELMEQQVSIATGLHKELAATPGIVTLITASDIRASGAANLIDVLRTVPGLHIRYQPFGYRPMVSFRGSNDKQTLLLVDGVPVGDLMWRLGIFWKGLPVSAIDRIEIIRGPGSALFGTDASAGVINVISKVAGRIDHSEAGARFGSDQTGSAWIQHGEQWNGFDLAFTAEFFRTDGFSPHIASDAQTQNDLNTGSSASLAPGYAHYGWNHSDLRFSLARDQWRVQLDYSKQDDLETGMTGAGAIDPVTQGDASRFQAALLFDDPQFSGDWGLAGELHYRHLAYSSGAGFQEWPPGYTDTSGVYPSGVLNLMASAENSVLGEISGTFRGFQDHAVTVGAGFRWQDIYEVEQRVNSGVDRNGNPLPAGGPLVDLSGSPYAFAPEKHRTITYAYVQDIWDISETVEFTAGARFDRNSDYGENINPRLALVWRPIREWTAKLLYGQAFRAPYFQELYAETSFSLPNPNLKPEESETYEAALVHTPNEQLRFGVNLFRYEQSNTITLQTVAGMPKRQYQNSGNYHINGLEFEAWWQPSRELSLSGNYSVNDSDSNGYGAFGTPNRSAFLRLDWQFSPGWHWNVQNNWSGEVDRLPGDARTEKDANFLTDTTLRYTGFRDWDLALSIRNVFDTDARAATSSRIPDDLPLPERGIYFEARYGFGKLLGK